jgi:Nitroreductase
LDKSVILEAFQFRHACKRFDPEKKISDEDFTFILETGRLSPSSFGFEPWKFVVLQNPEIRERLMQISWGAQGQLPTASHYVIVLARQAADLKAESDYIQSIMKDVQQLPPGTMQNKTKTFHHFLATDFELLGNDRAMFEWACRQAYIAIGNMMTAAALIGIDSCPIEGFNKRQVEALLKETGILQDESFGVACMLAFGYRAADPTRPKTRRKAEEVITWIR